MEELISKRLRYRVRTLGALLGETMTGQHGEAFLAKVEEIRHLAKSSDHNHEQLRKVMNGLDDSNLIYIARAFNQFLNLANIAEQAESTDIDIKANSHLRDLFQRLISKGVAGETIMDSLKNMCCDLVLTAHPTEITRRTLIRKIQPHCHCAGDGE